jgi:hypothetical protein
VLLVRPSLATLDASGANAPDYSLADSSGSAHRVDARTRRHSNKGTKILLDNLSNSGLAVRRCSEGLRDYYRKRGYPELVRRVYRTPTAEGVLQKPILETADREYWSRRIRGVLL